MHPTFEKLKRTRGYVLLGAIFVLLACVGIYYGTTYIKDTMLSDRALPVRAVEIDGALTQISNKEIADVAGKIVGGENIATANLEELKKSLMQIPWVYKVDVKKKLPDIVVISVVEHVPAAYWNDDGLYDAKARDVFYPNLANFNAPLVKLRATHDELAPDVYEHAVIFFKLLQNTNYNMQEVSLDSVRCYRILLSNGITLVLGRDEGGTKIIDRLKTFINAFSLTGLNVNEVEYIDLRYDVGFAVGKKQIQTKDIK